MAQKGRGSLDFEWIAGRLEEVRRVDSAGNVSYPSFLVEDLVLILASGLSFSEEVAEADARELFHKAIFAVGKKTITGQRLQARIRKEFQGFLRKTPTEFVLFSSVTIPSHTKVRGARINGATLSFHSHLPPPFDRSFVNAISGSRGLADDARLLKARVHLRARTISGAIRNSMDALDFVRGTWNLSLNAGRWREWTQDETKPVNKILPGPLHTLHNRKGRPAADQYWYEPFYSEQRGFTLSKARLARLLSDAAFIRSQCDASLYSDDLRQAITRYCRALDIPDPQLAFLKLWGLLEHLTATTQSNYDETIKRAVFIFSDAKLDRHMLDVLRRYRNRSVHGGFDEVGRENLVRLHGYVANILVFSLRSGRIFRSLSELGEFLALPVDADRLLRKEKLLRQALKFRGIRKSSSRSANVKSSP